ncbi:SbcC/MukB-like Walker B domain-containing protein, partial [Chloroflexota bacterium]
ETKLSRQGLEVINEKYGSDMETKTGELKESEAELAGKKAELETTSKEALRLESSLNQSRLSLQGRTSAIKQSISEAEEASTKLNKERELLTEIEKSLAAKDFASREQKALIELEVEIASLGYDASQHELAGKQMAAFQQYEPRQQKLEEAARLIGQEQEEVARAREVSQEIDQRLENDTRKKQTLASEIDVLPNLESNLQKAEADFQSLADSQRQAQETTGSLKGKLEHLLKQEGKKREKESRLNQVSGEESIYNALALAFGKKGIQAMLIEMALPEIEVEANRLLGRMTDNRMHVRIEAQRQSRKGEPIETLDINISDELGTRNYEMFSGGEAFRIDFAIRIALSQLLAKRAGTPLPTLIIDEGFGTQDSAGIEKLKEAINSIKDSFDKIIVITHMEELKDAFPTRINVVKTAEGSTLEVD